MEGASRVLRSLLVDAEGNREDMSLFPIPAARETTFQ